MANVNFKTDVCKGCGLCDDACPKHILELDENKFNAKGHRPAHCIDDDACVGCSACATMCPDCVITVER